MWRKNARVTRSVSLAAASSKLRTGPAWKKAVSIAPTRWTHRLGACRLAQARARARAPRRSRPSYSPGSRSAPERDSAGGRRQRVPRQRAGLVHGADRRQPLHHVGPAAEGRERQPAADDLAEHVRSGVTPYRSCARRRATRNPVITSSKTSSAPCASQSARSPSRKPGLRRARRPCSPPPARRAPRPGRRRASTAAAARVDVVVRADHRVGRRPGGTPGVDGMPSVAMPEPALASSASTWPW